MEAALAPGKRERAKAHNRAVILRAARDVFAEMGFGAASVRDVVRRTDLASGTFYNYFPDKEAVLRAIVDEIAGEIRPRVRAARRQAATLEAFIGDSFRAYFAYLAEDPETFAFVRRNAGVIRTIADTPALGASLDELREDLDAAIAAGALPPVDTEYFAAAVVGAGLELGVRMLERDPADVEGAAAFASALFVGGYDRLAR